MKDLLIFTGIYSNASLSHKTCIGFVGFSPPVSKLYKSLNGIEETMLIRKSNADDFEAILAIVNNAAQAYRGVIPDDRWHEPYMPAEELRSEIADGVVFWVAENEGGIVGVMGLQDKGGVALVRHAYVETKLQRRGIGTSLLRYVENQTDKPILIGTWAAASWAVDFYRQNGFTVLLNSEKDRLLRTYWSIPARQIELSVVLADRRWMAAQGNSITG